MSNEKLAEALRSNIREAMNSGVFKDDTRRIIVDWYNQIDVIIKNQAAEAARAQPQAAKPVAVIESAEDRHGPYLTHANVVLRVWNGYVPKAGDEIYTHPQPQELRNENIAEHCHQAGCQMLYGGIAPPNDTQNAKDAARYRWLLTHAHQFSSPEHDGMTYPFRLCLKNGFDLSTAIDAAMAKESGR